uniref:Uncharacterized protein n=1 Tax=Esox lucius TaxID=8010 RepID=A0A6Q2Z4G7_ESOLU
MVDISQLCAPIVVYQEDVREPITARSEWARLQGSLCDPVSCLIGSMGTLCARLACLPPLFSTKGYDCRPELYTNLAAFSEDKDRQENLRSKFTWLTSQMDSSSLMQNHWSITPSEKRKEGMPKLVEQYQFPGFHNDKPLPLPHSTTFSTIVTHVVRAQPQLTEKPRCKAVFQSILSSSNVVDFVIDTFWWLFLQNFKPDSQVQDRLFARIVENFIHILTQSLTSRSMKWFLKEFPSTLAQTLYCCFCCCFPQSCSSIRSDTFLIQLCFTAYQWTGGLCPAPDVFKNWDFDALEPEEATNVEFVSGNVRNEQESGSCLPLLDSEFSRDRVEEPSLSKSTSEGLSFASSNHGTMGSRPSGNTIDAASTSSAQKENTAGSENMPGTDLKALTGKGNLKPAQESHVVYPAVEFKRSMFNLYGNSPLLQYYMQIHHMETRLGQDALVVRTEIRKLPPYPFAFI